ncbi:DUF1643 domain-containing protein [Aliishimia ponticola]|uniref:DUF1643 domain-containing protein n=1 Tax=Aliishimia ponticola TaxID=2499833 RepID=A0A4S4N7X5_9RHOB|nr:DUF1643 domain-containing protein [Aliishimia ponticola]THH35189.1 DUF1643 domain-containing protein [Aliishimia ponticola]
MSHDPGGKTRLRLPEDVTGAARFSDCMRYRHALSRDWTPAGQAPRAILFVGLNPSVADADASDPTCHRELTFARDWGFTRYLKGNLLDWRATSPRDIPPDPALARSAWNMDVLREMAAEAETLVLASGNVHKRYATIEAETLEALRQTGKPLMCLGKNQSGAAKHPLYLRKDAALIPFD